MIDIKKYAKVLIDLKITPNQFFWLYLNMVKDYPLLYEYTKAVGFADPNDIADLVDRKLVLNLNSGKEMYADHLVVGNEFAEHFITTDIKDALEFWNKYPNIILVQGKKYKTKSVQKDEILSNYQRAINYNEDTHKLSMKCLKSDIAKGLINTKIDKYIQGKPWEEYDEDELKPQNDLI